MAENIKTATPYGTYFFCCVVASSAFPLGVFGMQYFIYEKSKNMIEIGEE